MIAPEPQTSSGRWKRQLTATMTEITGQAWCMNCRTLKPAGQVKLYRGMQRGTVARCDSCQEKRKEAMKK